MTLSIRYSFAIIFAICGIITTVFANSKISYDGHKMIRITVQEENEYQILDQLKNHGIIFTFDRYPAPGRGYSDIVVAPDHLDWTLEILHKSGMLFEETISDLGEFIRSHKQHQKAVENGKLYWDQYHTLAEIYEFMETQAAIDHQPIDVKLENIGLTTENRNLTIIRISKSGFSSPVIWIDSNMHAREWITGAVATYIIDQLLNNQDPDIQMLTSGFDFAILPIANPDGYEYTHVAMLIGKSFDIKDRLWRKTRSETGSPTGCMGVDPNRNYDAFWMESGGASSDPCNSAYAGASVFSEPETTATANFLRTIQDNLVFYLSLHSAGQYILLPTGNPDAPEIVEMEEYMRIGNLAAEAHFVPYQTNFTVGSIVDLMYPATGSSMDFAYLLNPPNLKLAMTYELRDKGQYGHLLPPQYILPSCEEFMEGLKVIVSELRNPTTPSTTIPTTQDPVTFPTTAATTIPTDPTTIPTSSVPTDPTTIPTDSTTITSGLQ